MAYLHDDALDAGLNVVRNATNRVLHICTSEPATRAAAITASLGTKADPTIGEPADRSASGLGRRVTVAAFTDGSVSAPGAATHYAVIDDTRLLAANTLDGGGQTVAAGNTFSLAAFDIGIPDAV